MPFRTTPRPLRGSVASGRRRIVLAGAAIGLLLAASAGAGPRAGAEVQAQLAERGRARVIVEFQDPAFAPGARARRAARRGDATARERSVRRARMAATRGRVEARLGRESLRRARRFADVPLLAIDADATDLRELELAEDVLAIHPDRLHRPALDVSVPLVGGDATQASGLDGGGSAIAVLDTGLDSSHPTFAGRVVAEACYSLGGDCPGGQTSATGPGAAMYCTYTTECRHGTHVAGVAAGSDATRTGVASGADLVAVQIYSQFSGPTYCPGPDDPCPLAYTSDIVAGLEFARTLAGVDVDVVNLSLSGGQYTSTCDGDDPPLTAAIAALVADGIVPVAAAGNDGRANALGSPACITDVVSVGATTVGDAVWGSSNSAAFLDLLAPGVTIESAVPPSLNGGGLWKNLTGTSIAAPHVSGAMAAMRAAKPSATQAQMLLALQVGGVGVTDPKSGLTKARLDVANGLRLLAPATCWNGIDDDGDGDIDHPDDPGCFGGLGREDPACQDGLDNDGDGLIDYAGGPQGQPADPGCASPTDGSETSSTTCGLGPELVLLLPALAALRRRRS